MSGTGAPGTLARGQHVFRIGSLVVVDIVGFANGFGFHSRAFELALEVGNGSRGVGQVTSRFV